MPAPSSRHCAGGEVAPSRAGAAGGADGSVEAAERGSEDDPAEEAGVTAACDQAAAAAISRIRGIVDARREVAIPPDSPGRSGREGPESDVLTETWGPFSRGHGGPFFSCHFHRHRVRPRGTPAFRPRRLRGPRGARGRAAP